jgi:hypothetical protein
MKTEPLCPKNHPRNLVLPLTLKSSMYVDYCWLRNRWRKLWPSDPKNHPRILVVRLTLISSAEINYSWQTNHFWNWAPVSQKLSLKPSSTADAEIFNVHRLLLAQKSLTKTRTLGSKKSSKKLVLRHTLTSSAQINYSSQTNPWWKLSPCCPKNHPRKPILRLTLKSSHYMDYCWLRNRWWKLGPSDAKLIQEAQFYGWRWHLLRK